MGKIKKMATVEVPAPEFDKFIAMIGGVRRHAADKQIHMCKYCGHDGGSEEVAKLDNVCGVSGYACIDQAQCGIRIKVRRHGGA